MLAPAMTCRRVANLPVSQSLWQANIFNLNDSINAKVYIGTTVGVTAFVFSCWWMYMHFSRKPFFRYDHAPATGGWLPV